MKYITTSQWTFSEVLASFKEVLLIRKPQKRQLEDEVHHFRAPRCNHKQLMSRSDEGREAKMNPPCVRAEAVKQSRNWKRAATVPMFVSRQTHTVEVVAADERSRGRAWKKKNPKNTASGATGEETGSRGSSLPDGPVPDNTGEAWALSTTPIGGVSGLSQVIKQTS